jgi:hypothetical protein
MDPNARNCAFGFVSFYLILQATLQLEQARTRKISMQALAYAVTT